MATTNIELDIENITGVSDADDQFIISAQKFAVASVPKNLLKWASTFTVPGNHGGNTSDGVKITMPIGTDSILDVSRNGFSVTEVPYSMKGFIANTASLHLATDTYPKYYLDDTNPGEGVRIIVKPIPTDDETAVALYVDSSKVDDDCDLRNAVVFHASSQEFTKLASGKVTDWSDLTLPVAPSSPSFGSDLSISFSAPVAPSLSSSSVSFSSSAPVYIKPSSPSQTAFNDYWVIGDFPDSDPGVLTISAVPPSAPSISAQVIADPSSFAPAYTKPALVLGTTPTISDLSISSVAPAPPSAPSFSTPTIGAVTVASTTLSNVGFPPTYTSPTTTISGVSWASEYPDSEVDITTPLAAIVTNVDLANGVFDVPPVVPAVPAAPNFTTPSIGATTVGSTTVSNLGVPPIYTSPTVTGGAGLTGMESGTIDDDTDQIEFDTWWDTLGEMIESEEDTELASAQTQKINSYISAYSQEMQDSLNIFNDANVEYQAKVQEAIQQAQINSQKAQTDAQLAATDVQQTASLVLQQEQQEYGATLQKYSSEIQNYQAKVSAMSAQAQGYLQTAEGYAKEIQARLSATQTKISEYQIRVQDALNTFNDSNAEYQSKLQESIQQAQINAQKAQQQAQLDGNDAQQEASLKLQKENQEYGASLQKYGAEVQNYQADVSKEVQQYQQNLAGDIQVWQAERQTDLQKYGSDIQNELNEFNKENAKYQAILQEYVQESQLLDENESRKIQKYQAEINTYSADVNKQVGEYTQKLSRYQLELGTVHQAWSKTESDNIAKYQADIQNELNSFNDTNAEYQAQLQISIQDAQLESQDDAQKIQKYSSELNQYQQDMNKEIQDFVNTLQKENQEYQSKLALYNADLQKYQAHIGEKTQKVASATQNAAYYSNESKKYYEWAITEIKMYVQNNSKMINKTIAAQAAAQQ